MNPLTVVLEKEGNICPQITQITQIKEERKAKNLRNLRMIFL
jgi:hypothetical protein